MLSSGPIEGASHDRNYWVAGPSGRRRPADLSRAGAGYWARVLGVLAETWRRRVRVERRLLRLGRALVGRGHRVADVGNRRAGDPHLGHAAAKLTSIGIADDRAGDEAAAGPTLDMAEDRAEADQQRSDNAGQGV